MEKNASHILDIHTHKSEEASHGRAIINYQLPVGGALCLSSFYSAGIHPWQLTERDAEEQLAYLQKLLVEGRLVAVGEAGLDKLTAAPMELQVRILGKQVELSEKYRLPLIIHCVKAMEGIIGGKEGASTGSTLDLAWLSRKTTTSKAVDGKWHISFLSASIIRNRQ